MLQEWQPLITIYGYKTYIIVDNFQNPSIQWPYLLKPKVKVWWFKKTKNLLNLGHFFPKKSFLDGVGPFLFYQNGENYLPHKKHGLHETKDINLVELTWTNFFLVFQKKSKVYCDKIFFLQNHKNEFYENFHMKKMLKSTIAKILKECFILK